LIKERDISDVAPNERPLEGMKVLELGQILAGAFTTTILGYFGAEVIKVEPPGEGDPIRNWRTVKDGTSLWWWSLARNKQSITINLKSREGQQLVRRLCEQCDVLIENFRPGQMEKWGLGPTEIKKINPSLIYTRISGYGQTGPYRVIQVSPRFVRDLVVFDMSTVSLVKFLFDPTLVWAIHSPVFTQHLVCAWPIFVV
jgi:crotonobetainyl-CoA:carnitine CoA-transferase CaiB-like acyl-CoA transferase